MGRMVERAFTQGLPNYREMREALHMLHRAYESAKEAGEDLTENDEK